MVGCVSAVRIASDVKDDLFFYKSTCLELDIYGRLYRVVIVA